MKKMKLFMLSIYKDLSRLLTFNIRLNRFSQSIEFLLLFCPILILTLFGAWSLGESRIHAEMASLFAQEKIYVELAKSRLNQEMAVPIRHMLSLVQEKPIQHVYGSKHIPVDTKPMEEAFVSLLSRNHDYDQVRWIDQWGQERVRVNNSDQGPVIVAKDQLQDKIGRYFFIETVHLNAGEIYISPLDLNIDNNVISLPFKPTIRVAAPVYDDEGRPAGLLMINVAARSMLNAFINSVGPAADRLMLLNKDGFWLRSPNKADEWGFMFQRNITLKERNPSLWHEIASQEHGQLRLADGLWVWNTVSPVPGIETGLKHYDRWKVLTHLPESKFTALEAQVWPAKIVSASVILLLFGIGIRFWLQAKAARVQAEKMMAIAHKEAEAALTLQETQASFQMLFEANTSGLLVVDEAGCVVMVNPALEKVFGYRTSELIGNPLEILVPDELASRHVEWREAFFRNPVNQTMGKGREVYGIHKDGQSIQVEVGLSSYRHQNKTFVLATIVDITERRQAQDQILKMNEILEERVSMRTKELQKAKQDAQRLANLKGDFLSNMSHEIRTPMNAILGIAYLLEKADLDSGSHELVKKIRIAGRSLLGIINDILDFSKIESGRLEIENTSFRLSDVFDNVATLVSTIEKKQAVELIIGPIPIGIDSVRGDALRLEQVLVNLISNALKFTEEGSVVMTVEIISQWDDWERLRFSIKDTGIGIVKEKQSEIFNAFAQEDSSTTRRFGGSGLGLSICKCLVQLMNGEIGVVSEPGIGSEFWFELPFQKVELHDYIQPSLAFQNVLIVDDHPVAREMLAAVVRSLGWSPEAVSSGEEALQRIKARVQNNKLPDIIFLDWHMPGIDGLEVGLRIKQIWGNLPNAPIIIIMTANDRSELMACPGSDQIDAILDKPVTSSSLFNAVLAAKHKDHQKKEQTHVQHVEDDDKRLHQLNVLVVDDSEINRDMTRRILEAEGAQVRLAEDGAVALEDLRLHSQLTNVVLMDVQMPNMDGYETTRLIREELGLKSLPIIALTAGGFKNQQLAAFAAGMDGFVAKPIDIQELMNLLQRYVRGEQKQVNFAAESARQVDGANTSSDSLIDFERGLRNWSDHNTYYKYLRKFVDIHGKDGTEISSLLAEGKVDEASACAHKLKGAAGNLAIIRAWKLAEKIEKLLRQGEEIYDRPTILQAVLDETEAKIFELTSDSENKQDQSLEEGGHEISIKILMELLSALDSDDPDNVEPLLLALEKNLPLERLKPIREMVDNFDFRSAEQKTKQVIAELNRKLEAN